MLHRLIVCAALATGTTAIAGERVEFPLTEGTWMSVDVSPDGRTIVFDLLNDIYVMPAKGGEARAILSGPETQRSPQFSPDGTKLLYLSDTSGADNLWIANADGSQPRQLSREARAMIVGPAWAPDGRSVVASRTDSSVFDMRTSEIWQFAVDGSKASLLVPSPKSGKDLQESRFSPDGRFLYYTERVGGEHYVYVNSGLGNFTIRQRDLASGETTNLIAGFGSATTPQVSPDGRSVAFVRRVGARTVLFRYDVASRTQQPVYPFLERDLQADYLPQEHYYPAYDWFPDGRHVAIWGKGKLLRVDMQTGAAEEIPFRLVARHVIHHAPRPQFELAPDTLDVKVIRQLALSPDGKALGFHALGKLWRQDLDGRRAPERLTAATAMEWDPAWSPDGSTLAYVAWDDETGSSLHLRSSTGDRDQILVQSRGVLRQPTFSPDGTWIAYRIMDADPSMAAVGDPPGIYRVHADGTDNRFLAPASGIARFSPAGDRLYYFGMPDYAGRRAVLLRSIGLAGDDIRDHAYAETADTGDFALSPDFRWLAFKEFNQLYITPFADAAAPVSINAQGNPAAQQLTTVGGFDAAWSADSSRLYWMLGRELFAATPASTAGGATPALREVKITAPADVPAGSIAFVNARILPMVDDRVIDNGIVVVERNRIAAVGPADSVTIPAAATIIDVAGRTILPGFFDAHGHIDCCFGAGVMPEKQPTRYAALAYGVTTNFDPYSNELTSYESAEMTITGALVGPRWLSSGQVIYGRSGKPDRAFDPIDSLEDARNIVRRKAAMGGTILKSYKLPTRRQKQALLRAAAEGGLLVDAEGAGHFYDNVSMILDGYTNLEHNLPVANYYDDLLQLFKRSSLANTPTLIVTFGELFGENYIYQHQEPWKEAKVRSFIPDVNNAYNPIGGPSGAPLHVRAMQSIHFADELYDIGFRSVGRSIKRLDDAGVTINVGSHGQASGIAIHWEMQLLAEGGMSPFRILRAATLNGARTYGVDHELGSLEPGKLADLVVLDRDPLQDIRNTNSVRYTMVNGRLYDAETMNEIGNHDRPRSRFFWEMTDRHGIDWNPAWGLP